jgi:hypothetical protein
VGIIWFTGITLPVIFFSFALAVDINSMVVAQNEVSNLAYAATIAGAHQIVVDPSPSNGMIDTTLGPQAVISTIQDGINVGATGAATIVGTGSPVISSYGTYNNDEITVTIQYQVPNLTVLGYVLGTGSTTSSVMSVSRTAFVCVPGDPSGPTGGYCVTPSTS